MYIDDKCVVCLTDLTEKGKKESIFNFDSTTSTCLAYKIFHMTGIQLIQEKAGKFTCQECHTILITIIELEKQFAKKFHVLSAKNGLYDENMDQAIQTEEENVTRRKLSTENGITDRSIDQSNQTDEEVMPQNFVNQTMELSEVKTEEVEETKDVENQLSSIISYIDKDEKEANKKCSCKKSKKARKYKKRKTESIIKEEYKEFYVENEDGKNWRCDFCATTFRRKDTLDSHRRRLHTGEKPYKCPFCGRDFADNSNYHRHIKLVHKKAEKTHHCDECDKSFRSAYELKQHKILHTNKREKPFECENCHLKFARGDYLHSHKKKCNGKEHQEDESQISNISTLKKKVNKKTKKAANKTSLSTVGLEPAEHVILAQVL